MSVKFELIDSLRNLIDYAEATCDPSTVKALQLALVKVARELDNSTIADAPVSLTEALASRTTQSDTLTVQLRHNDQVTGTSKHVSKGRTPRLAEPTACSEDPGR